MVSLEIRENELEICRFRSRQDLEIKERIIVRRERELEIKERLNVERNAEYVYK